MHRPGIEPGPPAWQASILPLNQRCWHTESVFALILMLLINLTFSCKSAYSQSVGFEPTLPKGNSFRVSRLNHSATTAATVIACNQNGVWCILEIVNLKVCRHRWFSGRMLACHAGGPGSIPGRCIFFIFQNSFTGSKKTLTLFEFQNFISPPHENVWKFIRHCPLLHINSIDVSSVAFLLPAIYHWWDGITDSWPMRTKILVMWPAWLLLARTWSPDVGPVIRGIIHLVVFFAAGALTSPR